jgi:hypothetical protein
VTSDQTGAVCPASLTTASTRVACGSVPPCFGVGTDVEATPDTAAGTCPSGTANTATDGAGNFCCATQTLVPCTTAAMAAAPAANFCVTCQGKSGGVCSPTEAQFVQLDITNKIATAPGPDNEKGSCYLCLTASDCVDGTELNDVGNECEDTGFSSAGTSAQCEAVITCVLASGTGAAQCANPGLGGIGNCYCGTDANCFAGTAAAPITAGVNSACDTQIAIALGFPLGDGVDIGANFTDPTRAGGRAAQIFNCAQVDNCNTCLGGSAPSP